jgi:hypothetical protein
MSLATAAARLWTKAMDNYRQKAAHEEQLLLPGNPFNLQDEELVARHHTKLYGTNGTPGESASLCRYKLYVLCSLFQTSTHLHLVCGSVSFWLRGKRLCAPTDHAVRHFQPRHCHDDVSLHPAKPLPPGLCSSCIQQGDLMMQRRLTT